MFTLQWFLNLASFGGVAILSVPVWSLNFRRKQLHRHKVADREEHDTESFRARGRKVLLDRHKRNVEDWRPVDQACLLAGYLLLLGSAFLRLLFPDS